MALLLLSGLMSAFTLEISSGTVVKEFDDCDKWAKEGKNLSRIVE